MGFLRRLFSRWRKKEEDTKEVLLQEERKSFSLYMTKVLKIVTYFRRERQIARRNLELTLVDNEDRPVYQIRQIIELLMQDVNILYVITGRAEDFEELAEEAMEEYGLLMVIIEGTADNAGVGNLLLDLNDWEKQLDIINAVRYNTMINMAKIDGMV